MSDKKRTASKDHVCPCKNCKSECTQSIKIMKRHLEVFGQYSGDHDNQLSESGSEDELLAKSNDYRHDDNDHDDQLSESGSGMDCWLRRTITDMMAMIHLRNYHIQVRKTAAEISNDFG